MLRQSLKNAKKATQRLYTRDDPSDLSLELSITEPAVFVPTYTDKPAVLRGTCQLKVKGNLAVKRLTVNFRGTSRVTWPHGLHDTQTVTDSTLTLLSPQASDAALPSYPGSLCDETQTSSLGKRWRLWNAVTSTLCSNGSYGKVSGPKYQRLSAGTHTYDFEMVLHSHLPESVQIRQSQVRYQVRACVECPGFLRRSVARNKAVTTVHCPAEDNVEDAEPVYIARAWKGLLQCGILVSRRGAPLGDRLPVSVSLTELAKAEFRGLRVFLSENVQYHQRDGLACCPGPFRRVLLYEKVEGSVSTPSLHRAGNADDERPESEAKDDGGMEKMIGDPEIPSGRVPDEEETTLDLTLQLPGCHLHSVPDGTQSMHYDTRYKNVRVSHWLEFVFVVCPKESLGSSNDRIVQKMAKVPLALRSCYAQYASASLPAYS
ncbi:arrestin domain-containing protein [Aspergillus sclerotioniger CBS 115572]|uniref:Arrestin domain-containing protein n=1 Tax=Aspergillus sclerotioniger CBS 115572 TaxID=1450535 RepID=A0A317X8Z0_9EURO|nr:arrestin domain-containing protein [Aspergillus sclerotioniger CBS 115572]PWY94077.1 arrestin domain-containing protein [Aspergillus sclerotioniger CBS 115572]